MNICSPHKRQCKPPLRQAALTLLSEPRTMNYDRLLVYHNAGLHRGTMQRYITSQCSVASWLKILSDPQCNLSESQCNNENDTP